MIRKKDLVAIICFYSSQCNFMILAIVAKIIKNNVDKELLNDI